MHSTNDNKRTANKQDHCWALLAVHLTAAVQKCVEARKSQPATALNSLRTHTHTRVSCHTPRAIPYQKVLALQPRCVQRTKLFCFLFCHMFCCHKHQFRRAHTAKRVPSKGKRPWKDPQQHLQNLPTHHTSGCKSRAAHAQTLHLRQDLDFISWQPG